MTSLVIDVRPARAADASELADVYAGAWREAYSGIIPALTLEKMIVRRSAPWWREAVRKRAILVIEVGGAVVGYASFSILSGGGAPGRGAPGGSSAGAAEIQELYLLPEYQGIGLGGRLFSAALKRIGGRGYSRVLVRALADNDRANAFYRRRGGKVVARTDESLGGRTLPCAWFEFRA